MLLIDAMRRRLDAPESISDVIYLAKSVKQLHTSLQTPLGRRIVLPRVPRQFDTSGVTPQRVLPLRLATARALDEIQRGILNLARNVEPLFHLVAVDRRLSDLSTALAQALDA